MPAVDASVPTNSALILQAANGDMKKLADLVKNAPGGARIPLAGLRYAMPVANPGKIVCLGLNYLDHVKEGPQKDNIPKFQSIFFRMLHVADRAQSSADPAEKIDPVRL